MRIIKLFVVLLIVSAPLQSTNITQAQNYGNRIDSLLNKLTKTTGVFTGPTRETEKEVGAGLRKMAAESADARSDIIASLIDVLKNPPECPSDLAIDFDHRWTVAVDVLGELRATEAIDILVRNSNWTGECWGVISINYQPASSALRKIGEPAVSRLIEALSDSNPLIRSRASSTLAEIIRPLIEHSEGDASLAKLIVALGYAVPNARGEAAFALGWIGGDNHTVSERIRPIIEKALEIETDQVVVEQMKYALRMLC